MKLKEMKVEEIKRKIREKVKDKICYKITKVKSETLDWGGGECYLWLFINGDRMGM